MKRQSKAVISAHYPRIIHALPGRVRIHVPWWPEASSEVLGSMLERLSGVRSVQANPTTRNLLIHYDCAVADSQTILEILRRLSPFPPPAPPSQSRESQLAGARSSSWSSDLSPLSPSSLPVYIPPSLPSHSLTLGNVEAAGEWPLGADHARQGNDDAAAMGDVLSVVRSVLDLGLCVLNLLCSGSVLGLLINSLELMCLCADLFARWEQSGNRPDTLVAFAVAG